MPSRSGVPDRADANAPALSLVSLAQAAGVAAAVLFSYTLLWSTWRDFYLAIDHSSSLFTDFRFHFYPMALQILEVPEPVDGYFYSAFFAILIRPFAWFPVDGAAHLWGWAQSLCFAALCLVPLLRLVPLSRRTLLLYAFVCMTSYPAISNFKWGQVSVPLTLLTMASFEAASRKRDILSGLWLAAAASIKYYSGVFFLFFVFRKNIRASLSFFAFSFLFFVAIPMIFLGPAEWFSFHRSVMNTLADSAWVAGDLNSQYFPHVAGRWAAGFSYKYDTPPRALVLLSWLMAAPNFALLFRIRRNSSPEAATLSLALIFTALPFLVATSWPHYFVYLPLCQVAAFTELNRRLPHATLVRFAGLAPIAISALFASLPFFLLFPVWASYTEKGFLFFANAALLPPLYAWALLLPAREPEASPETETAEPAPSNAAA